MSLPHTVLPNTADYLNTVNHLNTVNYVNAVNYVSRKEYEDASPTATFPSLDDDLEIVAGPRLIDGHSPEETLEVDFLPGGLTAMPGSTGNIVARRTTHTGPVYLLAGDVPVEVARLVLLCSPAHGTVTGIETPLVRALERQDGVVVPGRLAA